MDTLIVTLASFLAGMIDAIAGGGGLITVPALFAVFPDSAPASLLGTNKGSAIWGTTFAARQYARRVRLRRAVLLPAIGMALLGSLLGAWTVTLIDPGFLRQLLPLVLLALLVYTLAKKDLGRHAQTALPQRTETLLMGAMALVIGFYDGFFGPGTGSFLVFLFVRFLGHDFLQATANAKFINIATNFSALLLFAAKGHVWWQVALYMAVANVAGSLLGTRLALRHGTGFVRVVFILVVATLIVKTGWDALAITQRP
ncbi:MAG: TSUP family transporter [Lautropia sp.]|nr:TSUP family transporter [Lautropia sp.]